MAVRDTIIFSDVLHGLQKITDASVHIIVTSPPFNVGVPYLDKNKQKTHNDNMPHLRYLEWMKNVWSECKRVLCPGGRICINVDVTMNLEENGPTERVHPLHVDFTNQLRELEYIYRGEICWTKQNAPGKDTAWGSYCLCSNPHIRRNSEYIILASKDSLKLEGDHMKCDLTPKEFHEWTLSEWKIKPETGNKSHPVPFPRELVARCIKLFSYVGNTVLDPFNGSGTTIATAFELGRNYIGIDNNEDYCEMAKKRIAKAKMHQSIGGYQFTPAPILCRNNRINKNRNNKKSDIFP